MKISTYMQNIIDISIYSLRYPIKDFDQRKQNKMG